jgi:hypothetical protein
MEAYSNKKSHAEGPRAFSTPLFFSLKASTAGTLADLPNSRLLLSIETSASFSLPFLPRMVSVSIGLLDPFVLARLENQWVAAAEAVDRNVVLAVVVVVPVVGADNAFAEESVVDDEDDVEDADHSK